MPFCHSDRPAARRFVQAFALFLQRRPLKQGASRATLGLDMLAAFLIAFLAVADAVPATSPAVTWTSPATGATLTGRLRLPKPSTRPLPTVVYLCNLSVPRLGQDTDEAITADLVKSGHLVLVLDYARHPKALSPDLSADLLKIRQDIAGKNRILLADQNVDVNRLFILPEGFTLKRDVEFYRDGGRVLAMDIMYPSRPKRPVPLLMEITCDNANRMGSFSLLYCHDTLLEGGLVAGFAGAMIDHPVAPPYRGIDSMPDDLHKLKAAVRTLRAMGKELGLSGDIAAMGFSRGSGMAAMLAATGHRPDLEGDGPHQGISSRVQAAVVHGGRFDYLNLRADDPMRARFEKAWGPLAENRDSWARQGVMHYLGPDAAPMFLNTSDAESAEFRDGLAHLAARLKELQVQHVYRQDADGRGHRVSTDTGTLAEMYGFLRRHLR